MKGLVAAAAAGIMPPRLIDPFAEAEAARLAMPPRPTSHREECDRFGRDLEQVIRSVLAMRDTAGNRLHEPIACMAASYVLLPGDPPIR